MSTRRSIGSPTYKTTTAGISPPRLVETTCVIRIVETHAPISGDCMGCVDNFVSETSTLVEHTTWGEPWITSVCSMCAAKAREFLDPKKPVKRMHDYEDEDDR